MDIREAVTTLGISPDAQPEVIKQAWRRAASRAHPDHGGSHVAMRQVNLAFDYLSKRSVATRVAEWEALREKVSPQPTHLKEPWGSRPPYQWAYADPYRKQAPRADRAARPKPAGRHAPENPAKAQSAPTVRGQQRGNGLGYGGRRLLHWLLATVQAIVMSTLRLIGWSVGLLVRIAALAAAIYGWVQLDIWAFAQHPWGWSWWIGMVSAPVGCILVLRGALLFVFHGWGAMTRRLGWD